MVESVLKTGYFYFSTTYDITHTLQRLHNTSPEFVSIPLHERVSLPLYTIHDIKYFQYICTCVSDVTLSFIEKDLMPA